MFHLIRQHPSRAAWLSLGWTVAVSLWGAFVRATGSGAGCGSHWPLCDGAVIPRADSTAMLIEYSHRLTSGLALLAVVAVWLAFRRAPGIGALARRASFTAVVFMLLEAALGASLVLFELVADNASLARAMFMGAHLVNTFSLVAAMTVTAHAASRPAAGPFLPRVSPLLYLGAAALLLVNVSGAVAALGDTLFPAQSLAEALEQDLSVTSHVLIRLRLLHPTFAILGAGTLVLLLRRFAGRGVEADRWRTAVVTGLGLQVAAGLLNVVLLAPVWMQLVHLLFANLIWIFYVSLGFAALPAGAPVRSGGRGLAVDAA